MKIEDSWIKLGTILLALGGGVWSFYRLAPDAAAGFNWQTIIALAVAAGVAFAVTGVVRIAASMTISPSNSVTSGDPDAWMRSRIAPLVLTVGSIAIAILALGLIIVFAVLASGPTRIDNVVDKIDALLMGIFTAVLPVFSTWVGTVIAFYFTNESFRQAAESMRETSGVRPVYVTEVMLPYDKIVKIERPRAGARDIKVEDVMALFNAQVTRVLIFDNATKNPVFVIRRKRVPPDWLDHEKLNPMGMDKKIDDYLKYSDNAKDATQFAFAAEEWTVDLARRHMLTAECVDMFVTKNGQKTEPVLGWLSDDMLK